MLSAADPAPMVHARACVRITPVYLSILRVSFSACTCADTCHRREMDVFLVSLVFVCHEKPLLPRLVVKEQKLPDVQRKCASFHPRMLRRLFPLFNSHTK